MTEPSVPQKLKSLGSPMNVLRAGIQAVPAVRYALGIAGVAAALAIASAFFRSTAAALIGVAVMLPLMILLVVFAAITGLAKEDMRVPALVFTWAILVLFVCSGTLFALSVFFDWPKPPGKLLNLNSWEEGNDHYSFWARPKSEEGTVARVYHNRYRTLAACKRAESEYADSRFLLRGLGCEDSKPTLEELGRRCDAGERIMCLVLDELRRSG